MTSDLKKTERKTINKIQTKPQTEAQRIREENKARFRAKRGVR